MPGDGYVGDKEDELVRDRFKFICFACALAVLTLWGFTNSTKLFSWALV